MPSSLAQYLHSQRDWVTDFLCGLLEIPSESGDEAAAAEYLRSHLSALSLDCEVLPIPQTITEHPDYSDTVRGLDYTSRVNLRITKRGKSGKRIAINSHMDVVPPSPGQVSPYLPKLTNDGEIFARGACDAKGQLAAMALLLKASCEFSPLPHDVVCHMVVEEELGGNGTLALLENDRGFTADALINMEPTDLRVKPSIRGAVWFDLSFTGTPGHAGSAANTESSLYKAISAIGELRKYHAELLARSEHYGLFDGMKNPMPLTIGELHAGNWPAMVPGNARVRGVLGFLPNITHSEVMRDITALVKKCDSKAEIHFNYRHNSVELPLSHPFFNGMSKACTACGINGDAMAMTASTDAIFYQERGIPSLAFGPGSISDAHSTHEKISVDDIIKAAEVLYTFIKSFDA